MVNAKIGENATQKKTEMPAGGKSATPPAFQLKADNGGVIQKQNARADEIALALTDPVSALAVRQAATRAFALAGASGLEGPRDGRQDAFRHCIWNALATQAIGAPSTSSFTTLHELGMNPANDPENAAYDPIAIQMDLHNNLIGRQIGAGNPFANEQELVSLVTRALANGDLRMIKRNASGQFLDASGRVTTDRTKLVLVPTNHPDQPAGDPVYRNQRTY